MLAELRLLRGHSPKYLEGLPWSYLSSLWELSRDP
jgi:hypothetical protein